MSAEQLPGDSAPILVAVDGRAAGWEALRWAASEASTRDCPLTILHVFAWPPCAWDACGYASVNEWCPDAHSAAQALVDEAKRRALQTSPTLRITTRLEAGPVVPKVLQSRGDVALLVIGRSRPVGRLRPTPWSVSWRLARRWPATVVLVDRCRISCVTPSTNRVVVVVDDPVAATDAIEFALGTAWRRHTGVTMLMACREVSLRREAVTRLQDWSQEYPGVHVRQRAVPGRAGLTLAEESQGAALVVLGGHRRGRLHSALVGSLQGEAVREVLGPLAFVRTLALDSAKRT